MPYPALASSGDTASVNRKNKFLIASVAMVGASAIAVTPVAQNTAVVEQAKTLAYDLTAVMDATASPLDVYGSLFETTFSNLQHLGGAVAANPAPLLSQIVENQLGYAEKAGAAFEAIPTNLQKWYDGAKGKAMLDDAQAKLQEGDLAGAYELFNHSMLYAFQGAFGSLIAPGFILSGIPRGQGQTYQTGIPEQIAQNFTNLIAATFTSTVVVSTLFQGAVAIVSGPAFELARIADALSTTVAAGDFEGALNAVVNTPGILVNAALNGFKYADPDESGEGGNSEWPALLTWAEPGEQGGTRIVPGLLQNLLVNLPKAFAEAIDNTPPVVTPEADAARTIAVAQEVTDELTVSPLSKLAKSTLVPVKVETPAIEPAKVETAVEPVKEEVLKEETPSIEAAPVAADDSAAVTTPAVDKTAEANANADGTTTGKAKISDRIKAKFSEAKEARQAKAAAAKEAKAAAKEAKAEAKKAKAESKAQSKKSKESKSKESKKDSGSSS